MGRCYDHFPLTAGVPKSSTAADGGISISNGGGPPPETCDAIVGSLMNALESHLETDFPADALDRAYVSLADFSSPKDSAGLWLRAWGRLDEETIVDSAFPAFRRPLHLVTPQDTSGGKLVQDLVFCGVGGTADCTIDDSNAYRQFWSAAYSKFASQVEGRLQVIVESPLTADVRLLQESALAHLPAGRITKVQVWSTDCSADATATTVAYLANELKLSAADLSCNEDLYELALCHDDPEAASCIFYKDGRDAKAGDKPTVNTTETSIIPASESEKSAGAGPSQDGANSIGSEGSLHPYYVYQWLAKSLLWLALCGTIFLYFSRMVRLRAGPDHRRSVEVYGREVPVGVNKALLDSDEEENRRRPVVSYTPSSNDSEGGAESYFLGVQRRRDDIVSNVLQ